MHSLYVRHEFDECLQIIDKQLAQSAQSEYALYLKGTHVVMIHLVLRLSINQTKRG